jgi:hypothetical protein
MKKRTLTNHTNQLANCFTALDVDFLNPFKENDKLHLAENAFSSTHKDDILYLLSAQEISKHQRKDMEAHPWQTICVDLIGPYTVCAQKGTQSLHAMAMFDSATSWFEVVEIPNKRAVTCANIVENTWFCCYPRPAQCIFDHGSEFLVAEFANTLDSYGIICVPTTIKNPAANMVEERVHQTLGSLLRVYELKEYEFFCGDPCSNVLASAAWAICSMFHTALGALPGQLVYG